MGLKNKNLRKIFLIKIMLILFILHLPSVFAENYYADITIDVDNSGFITIDGITNHPELLVGNTEMYTSKKQSYWLLNVTKKDIFSEFLFQVNMPEASSINYVKSSGTITIGESQGSLIIKGFGENKTLSITIQYQIGKSIDDSGILTNQTYLFFIALLIIVIIVIIFFIISKKPTVNAAGYNFKGLNQRQKEIMNLLIKNNIALTQTEIQKELNIPKAAVSRNIRTLELKGLIEKEQIGMSNLIRLKKP